MASLRHRAEGILYGVQRPEPGAANLNTDLPLAEFPRRAIVEPEGITAREVALRPRDSERQVVRVRGQASPRFDRKSRESRRPPGLARRSGGNARKQPARHDGTQDGPRIARGDRHASEVPVELHARPKAIGKRQTAGRPNAERAGKYRGKQ